MKKVKLVSWVAGGLIVSAAGILISSYLDIREDENETLFAGRVPASTLQYASAQETIPDGESEAIDQIRASIEEKITTRYPPGVRPARRDAHAKHHGCVQATFNVSNELLPPELRVGVFSKNQSFPAWIRFSNGNGKPQADRKLDARGMAIKLMNVPGDKLLEEERHEQTQDFVMIDHPVFFAQDALSYVTLVAGSPILFFAKHLHNAFGMIGLVFRSVPNPLYLRYWSETPYLLGSTAVKYSAAPCSMEGLKKVDHSHPNYLREAMAANLKDSEACFQFMVQLRTDADRMPVEDPTIRWSEKRSPFIPVAKIKIPIQVFDSAEQMDFCENLSFTPWHALPEHRPLGGVNRARKVVYTAISKLRHHLNDTERREPVPAVVPRN